MNTGEHLSFEASQEPSDALPPEPTRIEIPQEDPAEVMRRDNVPPYYVGDGHPTETYRVVTGTTSRSESFVITFGRRALSGEAAQAVSEGLEPDDDEA